MAILLCHLINQEGRSDNPSWSQLALHLFLVLVAALLSCWPLLLHGIPDLSHDALRHAVWQQSFSKQLGSGEWYPRWLVDQNSGLGSPTFFFYPPIPSYASSPFRLVLATRDPDGFLQVGYGCALAVGLSAVAAYFWLCSFTPCRAALFGAIVYVVAPYHLAIDLYTRGAVAELWGFVWLPLVMLFVAAQARRSKGAFLGVAVTYALLVMTHLPTVVCFSPVALASVFLLAEPGRKLLTFLTTLSAMATGVGLAAVYLMPAVLDTRKVNIRPAVSSFFDYRRNWLFHGRLWPPDFLSRILFLNVTTLLYIGVLFWLCLRRSGTYQRRVATFYFGVAIFAFFFMTQLSSLFWRFGPFLDLVVFPWRFSTLLVLAAASLSALCFSNLRDQRVGWVAACLGIIVAGWIGAGVWTARQNFSVWHRSLDPRMITLRNQWRSTDLCEFLPASAALARTCILTPSSQPQFLKELVDAHPARSVTLRNPATGDPAGFASVLDWQPRKVVLDVDASENGRLTLVHFYYPGWQGHINGAGGTIPVVPSTPEGFLQMEVPEGKYKLVLELGRQTAERLGIAVSVASIAVAMSVAGFLMFRKGGEAGKNNCRRSCSNS
jgi:6-pyruvoyl-tetrahydropterin synthase related domain